MNKNTDKAAKKYYMLPLAKKIIGLGLIATAVLFITAAISIFGNNSNWLQAQLSYQSIPMLTKYFFVCIVETLILGIGADYILKSK